MKSKKNPKENLENYSKLFIQLGLVLALSITYVLIQNKNFKTTNTSLFQANVVTAFAPETIINYEIEKPIEKLVPKKVLSNTLVKTDNNSTEDEVFPPIIDTEDPVEISKIKHVKIDKPESDDQHILINIDEAPLFPGCKGTSEEIKDCFIKKVNLFVSKNFNSEIAQEIGLSAGVQRINTLFKIDKNGNIVDVHARAPHKKLQVEAIRVLESLPKMKPGKKGGKEVTVKYSMPIVFKIH